jgi:hypothetical protein
VDKFFIKMFIWARNQPLLYRFTLGLKILLAIAFIPTGVVKVIGLRFTSGLPEDSIIGSFFEILFQSNIYWKFLGLAQVVAGILILWKRTTALGAIIFLAIASNILFITISYDFGNTVFVAIGITLSAIWLLFWNWHKIRPLFLEDPEKLNGITQLELSGKFEKTVYVTGFFSGLVFFSVLRGLVIPMGIVYLSVGLALLCFFLALIMGIKSAK